MTTINNPFVEMDAESTGYAGGEQYRFKFPNGYGASVIRNQYSYGHEQGLWELAVLGPDGGLTYDTPITDDVLGRLTEDDVRDHLRAIAELPVSS